MRNVQQVVDKPEIWAALDKLVQSGDTVTIVGKSTVHSTTALITHQIGQKYCSRRFLIQCDDDYRKMLGQVMLLRFIDEIMILNVENKLDPHQFIVNPNLVQSLLKSFDFINKMNE